MKNKTAILFLLLTLFISCKENTSEEIRIEVTKEKVFTDIDRFNKPIYKMYQFIEKNRDFGSYIREEGIPMEAVNEIYNTIASTMTDLRSIFDEDQYAEVLYISKRDYETYENAVMQFSILFAQFLTKKYKRKSTVFQITSDVLQLYKILRDDFGLDIGDLYKKLEIWYKEVHEQAKENAVNYDLPKNMQQLIANYSNCRECPEAIRAKLGVHLSKPEYDEKGYKPYSLYKLLPGYLESVIDQQAHFDKYNVMDHYGLPHDDISKKWEKTGHYLSNDMKEYLNKMCEQQRECNLDDVEYYRSRFHEKLKKITENVQLKSNKKTKEGGKY